MVAMLEWLPSPPTYEELADSMIAAGWKTKAKKENRVQLLYQATSKSRRIRGHDGRVHLT